ncbi:MAG: hypothetical protein RMJ55_02095 [Roseiflexaceae bacterium]|nr:hypothetical protein [Roseiflexaceae bacterium]
MLFVSATELLADVLEGLVQQHDLESATDALSDVGEGRRAITDTCAAVGAALTTARSHQAAATVLPQRLQRLETITNTLLTIHCATSNNAIEHVHLRIVHPLMLSGIRLLTITGGEGPIETRIVGAPVRSGERPAPQPGGHPLLERVQVTYDAATPYPRLTVTTPSMAKVADWSPGRTGWQQRDSSAYDLTLFNARSRELGRITTQRASLPLTVSGKPLSVTFADMRGGAVLATTLTDASGNEIVRWLRVVFDTGH